ncbi:hypothetical protein B5V02_24710 [Mesorhizobium kowhaii]|jgi:hypothetical protein|uniref:Uncharacterized protein n=1 Tax=Mesorhizobium kowhaii TaxID=1300272 RepID=A0A2W7BY99_9HYPH|nr:hypothetical protein B5V02_24710 [Mesorhizobium kowhaii]
MGRRFDGIACWNFRENAALHVAEGTLLGLIRGRGFRGLRQTRIQGDAFMFSDAAALGGTVLRVVHGRSD